METMYHICAIIKDEHLFLREWISYHLSIGFDHITLYEDFTSKSHKSITDNYTQVTLLSMRDVPECKEGRTGRQIACYHHFIGQHSALSTMNYELSTMNSIWAAFIDIDEFFRLDDGWTLDRLTEAYRDTAGLCLWWQCYGANGHISRPLARVHSSEFIVHSSEFIVHSSEFIVHGEELEPGVDYYSPVQASYSDDPIQYNGYWQFKSFVNLNHIPPSPHSSLQSSPSSYAALSLQGERGESHPFINCHYHRFIVNLDKERADFRQNRNKRHIQYSPAHIDHYITKSWEDWQARLQRGNITKGIRDEQFFFDLNPAMRGRRIVLCSAAHIP